MLPRMQVRPAAPSDLDALVEGNRAMARETEDLELDPEVVRAGVQAAFADPARGRYFVAEDDGRVAGQLMVTFEWSDWRNADVWWIQSVYVWPTHRKSGVYRALYEHVHELAFESGAAGLRLYVDRRNVPAQQVYQRLGMNGDHYLLFERMFEV